MQLKFISLKKILNFQVLKSFNRYQSKNTFKKTINMDSTSNKSKVGIIWFRNDLRLTDNLSLNNAIDLVNKKKIDMILPFYCFDKETFEGFSRQAKLPRCGPFRRNFLIESVENLQENLIKKLKSNLFISYGSIEIEFLKLIEQLEKTYRVEIVIASKEIPSEEVDIETKLGQVLKEKKINFSLIWDSTMIHLNDLPYDSISKFPDVFTTFRKHVEIKGESNYKVQNLSDLKITNLPTCSLDNNWGHDMYPKKAELTANSNSAIDGFKGGEDAALNRVLEYFFKSDGLKNYKTTRNGMIGKSYSSKISMWLATGNVSARYLYWKVKEFEAKQRPNESTKHFAFELLWRDFFKFNSHKYGKGIFYLNGCNSLNQQRSSSAASSYSKKWNTDKNLFEKWCNGETGYPFVDANMKELKQTGWMSNRGRQNVASFLTKDLEIDWRFGAEWFETVNIFLSF
jgi:deoxyribodipyrimidine photo-lyase